MADYITIKDWDDGQKMALRLSGTGDGSHVQPMDVASRRLTLSLLRTVNVADDGDLSGISADLTLEDHSLIVIQPYFAANDGIVRITPVGIMNDGRFLLYETKESGCGAVVIESSSKYLGPLLAWDVLGAGSVAILATYVWRECSIYGGVI